MIRIALILAVALLAVPTAQARQARTLTIKVKSVQVFAKPIDLAPKGTSKGDTVQSRDRLENLVAQFGRNKGAVVGSDRGTMTFTGAHTAKFVGSAVLPDGTLTLNGVVKAIAANVLSIPVTGGTGKYAGAHGYLLIGPGSKQAENVYALTLPDAPIA
jgi:hypothetical protein